jgi:hypothetical protein
MGRSDFGGAAEGFFEIKKILNLIYDGPAAPRNTQALTTPTGKAWPAS